MGSAVGAPSIVRRTDLLDRVHQIGSAIVAPAADAFKPDLVLLSAGFDSRLGDPLGQFTLSDQDFVELTTMMLEVAGKHAHGRLISVLEGGYELATLPGLVAAALDGFAS